MAKPSAVNPPADSEQLPVAEAAEAVTGHEVAAGASEVAAQGGEGGGLPQFNVEYWGGQIIWLLILFALLYVLLSRVFSPRLRKALDEREGAIPGAIAAARQLQAEADAQAAAARLSAAEARDEARRTAADAKAAANADAARRQQAEEAQLNARLAEAEGRIGQQRDAALANVRGIAGDAAEAMVERLTGEGVTVGEVEAALDDAQQRKAA